MVYNLFFMVAIMTDNDDDVAIVVAIVAIAVAVAFFVEWAIGNQDGSIGMTTVGSRRADV